MESSDTQKFFRKILLEPGGYRALQSDKSWAKYLKDHNYEELLTVPRERIALYQNLLLGTVQDATANIYPYCKLLLEDKWLELIERYRRLYPNKSFQLYKSAEKFSLFLSEEEDLLEKHPFIADLALYEWMEVEVGSLPDLIITEELEKSFPQDSNDLVNMSPFWNPVHRYLILNYPIAAILKQIDIIVKNNPDNKHEDFKKIVTNIKPVKYIVYRDNKLKVRYFALNDLVFRTINTPVPEQSYYQIIENLWQQEPTIRNMPFNSVLSGAIKLFQSCFEEGLLVGSKPIVQESKENIDIRDLSKYKY